LGEDTLLKLSRVETDAIKEADDEAEASQNETFEAYIATTAVNNH